MSADKLGPIEIEFMLDKKADAEAKKLKASLDAVGTSVKKNTTNFKEEIKVQKDFIKGLTAEIKEMQKAYDNMIAGTKKNNAGTELGQAKRRLGEAQGDLIRLQRDQIEVNNAESQSVESLTGRISKWALSLGGAAAILNILKNALLETTGGLNLFNIAGAVTKQVLYNIVSGTSNWLTGIQQVVAAQKQLNELRIQEKVDTYKAKGEQILYNNALVDAHNQTKTITERIQAYDDALAHHKEAVRIEIASAEAQAKAYKEILDVAPDNDKAKMAFLDLQIKIQELKNSQESSMKEISSMQSGLIKKNIEEQKKWADDLHTNLQKLADEQIEIDHSISAQEKLLTQAAEDGNIVQVKAIAAKIRLLRQELDLRINIAKAALAEVYGGGIAKITHLPGAPTLSTAPVLPGLQGAPDNSWMVELARKKEWNKEDVDNDDKKLENKKELLKITHELTAELAAQLGMDEQVIQGFDALDGLMQEDFFSAAASMLSGLIKMIPSEAQKFANQINEINNLLAKQQKLIEQANRSGGTGDAYQKYIDSLIVKVNLILKEIGRNGFTPDLVNQLNETLVLIDSAKQDQRDFRIGGITPGDITSAITQGFEDSETAAAYLADKFEEFMKRAVNSSLEELSKPMWDEWTKKFALYMESGGGLDEKERAELKAQWDKIVSEDKARRDEAYRIAGFDPNTTAAAGNVAQDPLKGSVKGITEETAGVVAGQMTAMRINIADTNMILRQQILHTAEIASNTRYNKHLESIDNKLDALSTNILRSQGLT